MSGSKQTFMRDSIPDAPARVAWLAARGWRPSSTWPGDMAARRARTVPRMPAPGCRQSDERWDSIVRPSFEWYHAMYGDVCPSTHVVMPAVPGAAAIPTNSGV
eukprot:gene3333-49_t